MKKNSFYVWAAILVMLLPLICYAICSTIIINKLGVEYNFLTIYESEYYLNKYFWWIFLVFTPICFIFLLLSLRNGKKTFSITFSLLIFVLCLISFKNLDKKKEFTTSSQFLNEIEESLNYKFSSETFALFKIIDEKNTNFSIIYEGIIRVTSEEDCDNKLLWDDSLDLTIQNYLSDVFKNSISNFDNYLTLNKNDDVLVLAYSEEYNIIYCTFISFEV